MTLETCPTPQTLEELLLGKLPAPEREKLGEHLLTCEHCVATADTLSAHDEITEAIRRRRTTPRNEALVADVIQRGQRLHSEIETVESDVTQVLKDSRQHEACEAATGKRETEEKFDFLSPPEQPDEIGRLGGYRILEVLGVGGMGVVFRAEDPRLKRQIALKAMKPEIAASRSAKNRFLLEAQAAAKLDHDHVVHIYQVGEDRHIPFIAMQYLRGESLQARLNRAGRLEQSEVCRIGREAAAGLAAAHKQDLIHRDIKPDNIWLEAAGGRVKILDFGLVRAADEDAGLTQTGMVLGTPRYMSPEQARGEAVDARCDLFSLGAVLYHLAAGQPPFTGGNLSATLYAVTHENPAPLESLGLDLHPDLGNLVARLLSKNREQRPQTAEEAAREFAAIEKSLAVEPIEKLEAADLARLSAPKSAPIRFWLVTAAAVALAVLLGLWAAGILFKVETPDGALVVRVTGDDFVTSIQGQKVNFENVKTHEKFTIHLKQSESTYPDLKPGDYQFVLESSSGLKTKTNRFHIGAGKDAEIEAWWEPKSLPAADAARIADENPRPAAAPRLALAPFDADRARLHQEAWARYLGVPVEHVNSLGMKFRLIPPGEFLMGSTPGEIEEALVRAEDDAFWQSCTRSEGPQHYVVLTQPFYLGVHEVTQADYLRVMGKNPSELNPRGPEKARVVGVDAATLPADVVHWNDAAQFCIRLSQRESFQPVYVREKKSATIVPGNGYRLATEAEWEFACRAGTTARFWVVDADRLGEAAWFGQADGRSHAGGELKANPFGLYDMHGNVHEWVQDWWAADYYEQSQGHRTVDPAGPELTGPELSEGRRVIRGGDWFYAESDCRSSYRWAAGPAVHPGVAVGFRVALSVEAVRKGASMPDTSPQRPANFVEVHGVTSAALQVWSEQLPPGFRPAWIAPRIGAEKPLFDAVAIPDPDAWPWSLQAITGDSAEKYGEMSQTHRLAMSITHVASPQENVRLWVGDGERWTYSYGIASSIEKNLQFSRDEGAPPTSLTVLDHGDYEEYEAAFGEHLGLNYEWFLDLSPADLAAKMEKFRNKGWRPHLINTHIAHDPLRYLAVFIENPLHLAWDFSPGLTEPEYEAELASRKSQGFLPQCVCSWAKGEAAKYAVVWVREDDASP